MTQLEEARHVLLDADAPISSKAYAFDAYLDAASAKALTDGRSLRKANVEACRALIESVPGDRIVEVTEILEEIVAFRTKRAQAIAARLRQLMPGTQIVVRDGAQERVATFVKMHRTKFEGELEGGQRFRARVAAFVCAQEDRP